MILLYNVVQKLAFSQLEMQVYGWWIKLQKASPYTSYL